MLFRLIDLADFILLLFRQFLLCIRFDLDGLVGGDVEKFELGAEEEERVAAFLLGGDGCAWGEEEADAGAEAMGGAVDEDFAFAAEGEEQRVLFYRIFSPAPVGFAVVEGWA